jgi:hypothetical protein
MKIPGLDMVVLTLIALKMENQFKFLLMVKVKFVLNKVKS